MRDIILILSDGTGISIFRINDLRRVLVYNLKVVGRTIVLCRPSSQESNSSNKSL